MSRALRLALVVGLVLAVTIPASATPWTPNLVNERVYLKCGTSPTTKVDNLATPVGGGKVIAWGTAKPTTSYTAGGGCGTADPGVLFNSPLVDLHMEGTFTGNLDSLTIHLWDLCPDYSCRVFADMPLHVSLTVDGHESIPAATAESAPNVDVVPQPSSTGVSYLNEVTITGIGFVSEAQNREHRVKVVVSTPYLDVNHAWVYDAAEIDSGITFNPAKRADARLAASSKPAA